MLNNIDSVKQQIPAEYPASRLYSGKAAVLLNRKTNSAFDLFGSFLFFIVITE